MYRRGGRTCKALARDPSASLEDWQKLAKTGKKIWVYNGRDRKKTGKMLRNGHFGLSGLAVSESWLRPCVPATRHKQHRRSTAKDDQDDERGGRGGV